MTTRGSTGDDLAAAGEAEQLVGASRSRQLLEVLDRREDEQRSRPPRCAASAPCGREPAEVDALVAVDRAARRRPAARARKKWVSNRTLTCARRDPAARTGRARAGRRRPTPASSSSSRTAATPVRGLVALALVRVDRAAREDPRAAHEPRRRVALHQQHLERLGAAAQQDHRRRLPRHRRLAPSLSSSPGPGRSTSTDATLPATRPVPFQPA